MQSRSKTKIVCTIGPSCESPEILRAMMEAGMSVARLNFSHGSSESHRIVYQQLRQVARELELPLCIFQDLSGPKLRIGKFREEKVFIKPGEPFILTGEPVLGDESRVHIELDCVADQIQVGQRVLLADGLIELKIQSIELPNIITEVQVGGWLSDRKGISFPGRCLPLEALTEKDLEDLKVGLQLGVDYVALSFVRNHKDVLKLQKLISEAGGKAKVIAKLERMEALEDLDAILDVSDGVMVARGDLGIDLDPEKVPLVQKQIIREAQRRDVYVITATQMLESMIHHPWPTRAETSDVANAVLDGTDAIMLSGETAIGKYPVRTVEMMRRIACETESVHGEAHRRRSDASLHRGSFAGSISWAAGNMAQMTHARAICAYTHSGATARLISKSHPEVDIIGLTPDLSVLTQINLAWGVTPILVSSVPGLDEMIEEVEKVVLKHSLAENGDTILIVAGYPLEQPGLTNLVKIHKIGGPDPNEWQGLE